MNGRGYDYNVGRFLSVDPIIQAPGNSQSLNPYSYIMNNPLSGTDPTGYCSASRLQGACDNTPSVWGGSAGNGLGALSSLNNRPQVNHQALSMLSGDAVMDEVLTNTGDVGKLADRGNVDCPNCHGGDFVAPEFVTPELRAATTQFYQNLGEDTVFLLLASPYHLITGEYFFIGEDASRLFGTLGALPLAGFAAKNVGRVGRSVSLSNKVESFSTSAAFSGNLYPDEKIIQLVQYLDKRGVSVMETRGNPSFTGNWNGTGVMRLPETPTELQVKHELSHFLDFRNHIKQASSVREGVQNFVDMGRLGREQAVLDRLMNNRVWNRLNDAERSFSINYVERLKVEAGQ
nr:RHS repeat-associated core domain-containing protein [Agarilytica rhodophyticola]